MVPPPYFTHGSADAAIHQKLISVSPAHKILLKQYCDSSMWSWANCVRCVRSVLEAVRRSPDGGVINTNISQERGREACDCSFVTMMTVTCLAVGMIFDCRPLLHSWTPSVWLIGLVESEFFGDGFVTSSSCMSINSNYDPLPQMCFVKISLW